MPESGSTWQRPFAAQPIEARALRTWIRARSPHPDAAIVAHELFAAVAAGASLVEVAVSTAGTRVQITATSDAADRPTLTGLGHDIVAALATQSGTTPDGRGLWALLSGSHP